MMAGPAARAAARWGCRNPGERRAAATYNPSVDRHAFFPTTPSIEYPPARGRAPEPRVDARDRSARLWSLRGAGPTACRRDGSSRSPVWWGPARKPRAGSSRTRWPCTERALSALRSSSRRRWICLGVRLFMPPALAAKARPRPGSLTRPTRGSTATTARYRGRRWSAGPLRGRCRGTRGHPEPHPGAPRGAPRGPAPPAASVDGAGARPGGSAGSAPRPPIASRSPRSSDIPRASDTWSRMDSDGRRRPTRYGARTTRFAPSRCRPARARSFAYAPRSLKIGALVSSSRRARGAAMILDGVGSERAHLAGLRSRAGPVFAALPSPPFDFSLSPAAVTEGHPSRSARRVRAPAAGAAGGRPVSALARRRGRSHRGRRLVAEPGTVRAPSAERAPIVRPWPRAWPPGEHAFALLVVPVSPIRSSAPSGATVR
jgi:hypothetical protein